MSLQTWMDEFYPIPAQEVDKENACAHSLKKWEGLRAVNLSKHGLSRVSRALEDKEGNRFLIDSGSCALCTHYLDSEMHCPRCPLSQVRGGTKCDSEKGYEEYSPYFAFISVKSDPEPMIEWLQKALESERKNDTK